MTSRAARNVEALRCQMDSADSEGEYLAVRDDYEAAVARAAAVDQRRVDYIAGGCSAELAARLAREDS